MADTVAYMVHYTGGVQGVGFRATTAHLARAYPVTGWVRNLPDGRVQILVEGPAERVDAFLLAVRAYWRVYLDGELREEQRVSGKHTGFQIVH